MAKTAPPVSTPLEIAPSADDEKAAKKEQRGQQKIIVLLDKARMETVKTKKGNFELMNCDDHRDICKRNKKDHSQYRPDIIHQELLALMDSPLNKAGRLKVYIRTENNVLIDVDPSVRVPRTFKRFCGLMVQLLHKMKIKASTGGVTLLRVVKNPFSQYLPAGVRAYGLSAAGKVYSPAAVARSLVPSAAAAAGSEEDGGGDDAGPPDVCFVIGAMASGSILKEDHPFVEEMIGISEYSLSGASAINRLLGSIEAQWGIV